MTKHTFAHWRDVPADFWRWPNFSPEEIACRGTGKLVIVEKAMDMLQALRTKLGKPLIVNSGYRSPAHNRAVGGAPNSQHPKAKAFDISMSNHDPIAFEAAARAVGFTGFGFYVASDFMHIDIGPAREWGTRWPEGTPTFSVEAEVERFVGAPAVADITYRVALELVTHEGLIRQAYRDSVDVWTWSVGITSASGHDVERYIGKPQSMEWCLEIYVWALERYAEDVRRAFAGHELTEAQFAAALSFHYNTGGIARASWVRLFKAGQIEEARDAFMLWRKPPEILGRRRAERDLFFDGKWSQTGEITEYTRVTSRGGTPDWGSAKRVNIEAVLRRVMGEALDPDPVTPPSPPDPEIRQPDDPGAPEPQTPKRGRAGIVLVVGILSALMAWGAATGFDFGQLALIIDMLRSAQ